MREIISRKEAKERGLKRYFTGEPCKRGHIAERLINNHQCYRCSLDNHRCWQLKNRDYLSKYQTEKNRKKRKNPEPRECQCGTVFTPARNYQVYCSRGCNKAFRASTKVLERVRFNSTRPLLKKSCLICEATFETKKSQKIYCSDRCRRAAHPHTHGYYKPRPFHRKCLTCGSEFISSHNWMTCSRKCTGEHKRAVLDLWKMRNPDKVRVHQKRTLKKSIALRILEEAAKNDPKLKQLMGEINDAVS